MARITQSDALNAVTDILNANGGKMKYAALVDALNNSGKGQIVSYLPSLKAQKLVASSMEFETPESSRAVGYVGVIGGAL